MSKSGHTEVSGTFVKISATEQGDIALSRDFHDRPEGRYNRKGQDALYLSVNEKSARVAMKKYADEIEFPVYLIEYKIDPCSVVDLRSSQNVSLREMASKDWKKELASGKEPSSWEVSDTLRKQNEIGLIDPSRKDPEAWHLTLFRWNEPGAPKVTILEREEPVALFSI